MNSNQKVVYIAMCADILHPGHLNIIQEGTKRGLVVVGLLTDEAMASYKRRPVMSFDQRRTVVESIKGVDRVTPQTTLDYRPNLRKLKPDYVVHGSDWRTGVQADTRQQVIDTLAEWGGELIEPDYTQGVSTTQLIDQIKNMPSDPSLQSLVQGDIPAVDLDAGPLHPINSVAHSDGGVYSG